LKERGNPYSHIRASKAKDKGKNDLLATNERQAMHVILEANPIAEDVKL